MIRHIIRLIWNRKRGYGGILAEQALIALILMLCMVSLAEAVRKYKSPGMLNSANTLMFGYIGKEREHPEAYNNAQQSMAGINDRLRKLPFVEYISQAINFIPYLRGDGGYRSMVHPDTIVIDDRRFLPVVKYCDEYGAMIFRPEMEEGRWLDNRPLEDGSVPVVITRQFAEKAGWQSAQGKKFSYYGRVCTVVGTVSGLKQQVFDPAPVTFVLPMYLAKGFFNMYSENTVKLKPGTQAAFSDAFYREFRRLISDNAIEPVIFDLRFFKKENMMETTLPIVLQSIPTFFLFIFAFIGAFGLYWLHSRKRVKEFAVRMAMGSSPALLMAVVIGESLLITAIAVVPALALSFFIYEYTSVHVIAVSLTVAVMLLFSLVSAWYPAWKVSRVNPAEALQYE
ncbi:MAG: ABC transporter permease [Bacteroidales bacterium]|jgi:hypothetical protein|nr:ABC transporter permease [Bacteroidales bacterium]